MNKRILLLVVTHTVLAAGSFAWGWRVAHGGARAAEAAGSFGEAGPAEPAKLGSAAEKKAQAGKSAVPETGPEDPAAFVAWAQGLESPDPFSPENAATSQLKVLFHTDRQRALRIALLAQQAQCGLLFATFVQEWGEADLPGAVEWAKSLDAEAKSEALTDLISAITSETASMAVQSLLPELPADLRIEAMRRILVWSYSDPAACFAWMQSLPQPDLMRLISQQGGNALAFSEMVKASPELFPAFVRSLPTNDHSRLVMERTAADLTAIDPGKAVAWAGSIEADGARVACLTRVLREWVQTDPEAATAGALAQTDPRVRRSAIEGMASQALETLGRTEGRKWVDCLPAEVRPAAQAYLVGWLPGEEAGEYLTELLGGPAAADEALPRVARRAGSSFAAESPEEAAKWVAGIPAGDVQREAAAGVVSAWIEVDPVASSEWAATLEGDARDGAAAALARGLVKSDPEAAFQWAASVDNEDDRAEALRTAMQEWKRIDRAAARQTIEASGLAPAERAALLFQLGRE